MSVDSGIVIKEVDIDDNNSVVVVCDRHVANIKSTGYSASKILSNIRQLQTEFQVQYQHDKKAMTELNHRFRLLLDHVQLLESQKEKYLIQIANLRQLSGLSDFHIKWNEDYLHLQSDLTTINSANIDSEFAFELSQLQIGIYQQLIDIEQQWKNDPQSKLQEELNQSTNILISLRTSYGNMEQEIANLYQTRENTFKQYLKITQDWCQMKKQQKKWEITKDILKNQIACYKNLRSYSLQ